MALPTTAQINGLDIIDWATPYVLVTTKNTVNANSLDIIDWATPSIASIGGAAAAPSQTLFTYVNVGGTWKTVTDTYVNVGGTWKTVSETGVNISTTWKT